MVAYSSTHAERAVFRIFVLSLLGSVFTHFGTLPATEASQAMAFAGNLCMGTTRRVSSAVCGRIPVIESHQGTASHRLTARWPMCTVAGVLRQMSPIRVTVRGPNSVLMAARPSLESAETLADGKGPVLVNATANAPKKRGRGIGKSMYVSPAESRESSRPLDESDREEFLASRKARASGIREKDIRTAADLKALEDFPSSVELSEGHSPSSESSEDELEREWAKEAQEAREAREAASARPAGARWRHRLGSARQEEPGGVMPAEKPGKTLTRAVGKSARRLLSPEAQVIRRRAMGLARHAASEEMEAGVHANPGAALRREKRESAGMLGVVPMADLKRRGLVRQDVTAKDWARGTTSLLREVPVHGALFDIKSRGVEMFAAGADSNIAVWDLGKLEKTDELTGHTGWVNSIKLDGARGLMLSASDDGTVRVWDLKSRKCIKVLKGHDGGAISMDVNEQKLFVGCHSKILVWNTESWTLEHRLTNHTQVLRAMTSGQQLSKNIRVNPRVALAREASKLFGHRVGGVVRCGKYMLTAVDEGTIWVWNVQTMEVERKLLATDSREGAWVRPMLLLPSMKEGNGRGKKTSRGTLVTGWADGAVRVFDMDTWKLVKTLYSHSGPVLALVNVGGHIISTGADMTANEWDPATWTITRSFRGHMGAVSAAVGGLGDEVLTASLDGFLKLWPAAIADCHAA